MKLYDNIDNNINYESINIKLRKINDDICDSIIKKTDGYYCRIVCGYKPYDAKHTYGNNIIHNGLYMIYPLPQNEIQEFKLDNFIPPKLLDGNSLITVDSFNSTNPSEFTIKVPIDRRYMAHKEYIEDKNVFLKAREDRNYNKTIQIKEIYNDTNNYIGMPLNISLTNNKTETVTFYKENEDAVKLKLLSIEGNTTQSNSDLSNIVSVGELQEDTSWTIELISSASSHSVQWTGYQYHRQNKYWFIYSTSESHYNGKITNKLDKNIVIDIRDKHNKTWRDNKNINTGETFDTSSLPDYLEFAGIEFYRCGWPEREEDGTDSLPSKDEIYSLLVDYKKTITINTTTAIQIPSPLRAIKQHKDKLYLEDNKYFINKKIENININNYAFKSKEQRTQTLKFYIDTNIESIGSTVIGCLPNNITCDSEDVSGMYMSVDQPGRIIISVPLSDLNNDISDNSIKQYFNNKNPELLFVKKFADIIETSIDSPILLDTVVDNNFISINNDVKGAVDLEIHYDEHEYEYATSLIVSNDKKHLNQLTTRNINLPRVLKPNEIYSWDDYRKHYTIKKNVVKEEYQNYASISRRKKYRYVRESINGSSTNTGNHWVEIEVWHRGRNLCKSCKLSSSSDNNTNIHLLTDGNLSNGHYEGASWIQVDLLQAYDIDKIKIWHYYHDKRIYRDVKVECSIDGITWDVIYNNETPYQETASGKTHIVNKTLLIDNNSEFDLSEQTDKLLISKQSINNYQITFKNNNTNINTVPITMNKVNGVNKTAYFNIINKPKNANKVVFDIIKNQYDTDISIVNENFNFVTEFKGRINESGILVTDDSTRSYCLLVNTDDSIDLFIKGGNILKIGYIQKEKNNAANGDVIVGIQDYSDYITEKGVYLNIDLKKICPIRDVNRLLVINTNSIGTVEANPCTELFVFSNTINLYENIIYDDIEYFEDQNEIIEIDYKKIKDHEKPYTGTLTINDWRINESGEIERTEDGKAYSAIALCDPKDSFKISGDIDICLYAFLDKNYELIAYNNALTDVKQEVITTVDAPEGTKYCLFYLNTEGLLKERDINLILQSFQKSSEIDNYIKIENNPTISVSAPYKKIRPLDAPTNIVAVDQKTSLVITWDEVLGAAEYVVFLENEILETVTTNRLELFRELRGNVSIKAINDLIESPFSDRKFIHSVPRNPFIIYIDNIYENNKYTFDVTFKDNSELETSYKLKYIIDDRAEETVELPGYEGIGTLVKGSFSSVAIDSRVRVRVLAVNDQGENEVAPYIEMRMPPDITWAYKEDSKQLVVSWLNTFPESDLYLLRYKLENAEHFSTQTILNEYAKNARISAYLPLKPNEKMTISLAATVREDLPHIFSKPIQCYADKDVNLVAPLNFKSKKIANNQIEFSWTDSHGVEDGWELALTLNNTESETIFIPSTSVQSSGSRISHTYTFPTFGFVEAKLRMKWALGVSRYTETLMNYYFEVINTPPHGIKRTYINDSMIKFKWTPQNYVDHYNFSIKKKTDSEFKTITVTAPEYYFENFEEVDYVYNIQTEFLGEITSDKTKDFEFKPTIGSNSNIMNITNKFEKAFAFAERTTTKMLDKYDLVTKSIKQDTSIKYPINMYSTTEFTMVKGLIAIETWGVGQRTEGLTNANIVNKKIEIVNPINTISYKETDILAPLATTIITPTTNNYMVLMEINKTRIVCFGDSITAGHPGYWAESGTGDIEHSYPYWLDRRLKFKYEVINKGYGSDRTYDLLNRMDKDVIALNPQYCLIQIGTNDIYWGAAGANGSKEAFEEVLNGMKNNMRTLVKKCMDNGIKPIIGQLIPRTQSVTDELVKYGLYSFNEWIVEYANTTEGLNYIDFFNAGKDSIPPTPLEDPNSPGAMNPIYDGDNIYDEMGHLVQYGAGIHLNKPGYKIMAEAIPLNLFNDYTTGLKLYLDKDCTMEAEYNIDDKQNPYYRIAIEAMQLTRTKKIVRYIKNVGIGQTLFALYPTKIYNLKYSFKTEDMEKGEDTAYGILSPGKSIAVIIELTPQTEDSKSEFELSLVGREFLIKS